MDIINAAKYFVNQHEHEKSEKNQKDFGGVFTNFSVGKSGFSHSWSCQWSVTDDKSDS